MPTARTGVIAQDVAKVLPDAVYTSGKSQNPFISEVKRARLDLTFGSLVLIYCNIDEMKATLMKLTILLRMESW